MIRFAKPDCIVSFNKAEYTIDAVGSDNDYEDGNDDDNWDYHCIQWA